ncbi:hypothetical protein EJ06DRAFT_70556 [Trichodelitschia bisporula]|uniref:Uncharacterized protein n=1 Tax=Trichodelitschia bisporula TaxID=703511 RepID=A0A6G1HTA3_9PEZI|nr:hypothetical protein EJ06DRAFT_70556 [Trichodelitschia bisporula]
MVLAGAFQSKSVGLRFGLDRLHRGITINGTRSSLPRSGRSVRMAIPRAAWPVPASRSVGASEHAVLVVLCNIRRQGAPHTACCACRPVPLLPACASYVKTSCIPHPPRTPYLPTSQQSRINTTALARPQRRGNPTDHGIPEGSKLGKVSGTQG